MRINNITIRLSETRINRTKVIVRQINKQTYKRQFLSLSSKIIALLSQIFTTDSEKGIIKYFLCMLELIMFISLKYVFFFNKNIFLFI